MLTKFADELRNTRLKKGISLEQMAAKTRIDLKFLEAIDNGNFGFLPELYVKAFIKQYAKVLDLDEQETVNRYEEAKAGKLIEKDDSKSLLEKKIEIERPVAEPKSEEPVKTFNDNEAKKMNVNPQDKKKMFRLLTYVSGIVVVTIIVFIAFFNKGSNIIVEEKPYDKVLEETKGRYIPPEKKDESLKNSVCGNAAGRSHKTYTQRRKCGGTFHLTFSFEDIIAGAYSFHVSNPFFILTLSMPVFFAIIFLPSSSICLSSTY